MNEQTTPSILQRVPVILAVTAASYGLAARAQVQCSIARNAHAAPGTATDDSCAGQLVRDAVTLTH